MQETSYKIFSWGEPTGDGSGHQFNVSIRAKAKRSSANQFEIANELICMRLGLALKLPIPTGVLLDKDNEFYFASLHVATAGERLPPALDEDIAAILNHPWLTTGIIVFDAWIVNEDRWAANISYNEATRTVQIFDHGKAFYDKSGTAYLESCRDKLCISADNHCLAEHVTALHDFDEWHTRINEIPEYFIRETISQATIVGLPHADVDYCTEYLLDRRRRLKSLFCAEYKSAFPKLDHGLFDPFKAP